MARIYEFMKGQVVFLLARGELISSKPQKEANRRREASRILQEIVGDQPIISDGLGRNRPPEPIVRPIISDSTDSVRAGDSRQPYPLSSSDPAEHQPRVFIRSRL